MLWEADSLCIDGSDRSAMRKSAFGLAVAYSRVEGAWVAAIAPGDGRFPALATLSAAQRERAVDGVTPADPVG